ncbi:6-bladed beta-propeller [Maribellus maritimus]|uniref:6-bladed beta-propeller n=1 Tax=Maribellus maritimus TaxID=2870838 RepID=UPI001EEA5ADF|nr:6-bladed beta-propeller [Maribellus maritimus]MCG6189358.1 6-bladed beta-propeller [Maribellus maritimus]
MKNRIQLFCLFITVLQCAQLNAQTPEIIDVESAIKNEKALSFNDFADEVKNIPLETTNNNLIGRINFIKTSTEFIFVATFNPAALYRFDRSGKFLNKIGRKGRGPNEYNYIYKIGINEVKNEVFVLCGDLLRLLIYDFDGTFKRDLNDIVYPSKIIKEFQSKPFEELEFIYEDYFIVPQCNFNGATPYSYEVYTHDGKFIKKAVKPVEYTTNMAMSTVYEFSYFTFDNIFYTKENLLNDTLYKVTPSLEFQPRYIFDEGKYRTPVEFRKDFENFIKKKNFKFIQLMKIFESKRYIIFFFVFDKSDR